MPGWDRQRRGYTPAVSRAGVLRVVHPFPSVLVAAITVALALLWDGSGDAGTTVVLGAGMLLFQFSIGTMNDIAGADEDAVDKPGKPIPAGDITNNHARWLFAACLLAGCVVTLPLGPVAWVIGLLGVSTGLVYDVWLKSTAWSWAPYALAFPLVPIWVAAGLDRWESMLAWSLPLGAVLGFAIHLANQAPDLEGGTGGFVGLLGERRARAAGAALVAVVGVGVSALRWGDSPWAGVAALGLAVVAVVVAPAAPRLFGRDGLFGVLSLVAGGLAVVFLSGIA